MINKLTLFNNQQKSFQGTPTTGRHPYRPSLVSENHTEDHFLCRSKGFANLILSHCPKSLGEVGGGRRGYVSHSQKVRSHRWRSVHHRRRSSTYVGSVRPLPKDTGVSTILQSRLSDPNRKGGPGFIQQVDGGSL